MIYNERLPFQPSAETPTTIDDTLVERGAVHGNFKDNASVAQDLKRVINTALNARMMRGQGPIRNIHLEALDLIATKISRILSGDAEYSDHWHDIQGYARLAEKACGTDPNAVG